MSDSADVPRPTQTIVANSYTTVIGRTAVAENTFRAYWRDVHGPLCSRVPGLGWYVQHHFARQHDTHLWPLPPGTASTPDYHLDGAVEIGWSSLDDQQRFQEASPILFSDEQNVFEETAAYALPHGSTTIVERSPEPAPNGHDPYDRVHVHLTPRTGATAELVEVITTLLRELTLEHPDDIVTARLHAPEPHDNSSPNPPAPNVAHTMPAERVHLVIAEIAFSNPLARRRVHASPTFEDSQPHQGRLVSHLAAFAVSGVHTFVHNSQLTTAGLRGSRVAELINDLAAANQVSDDVTHLMRTGNLRRN
jgi:hypothetical protein